MSTTSAPRGLKPIGILGGTPFAGSTREYLIKSGAKLSSKDITSHITSFKNVTVFVFDPLGK